MSFNEFVIIYLSAGAPFGVLLLFSRRLKFSSATLLQTVLAVVFWPYFAISRFGVHYKRSERKGNSSPRVDSTSKGRAELLWPREIGHRMTAEERDVIEGYCELTGALFESWPETEFASAELFRIAGHSNPEIGARCLSRQRRKQLAGKQKSAAAVLVNLIDQEMAEGSGTSFPYFVSLCRNLGDNITAARIESLRQTEPRSIEATEILPKSRSEKLGQTV